MEARLPAAVWEAVLALLPRRRGTKTELERLVELEPTLQAQMKISGQGLNV